MIDKIRFLTIFPACENIHLIKDVGMIPYVLHKEYGFDSTLGSYDNGEYSYLKTDVKGLKQIFINKRFTSDFLNSLLFIFKNYKKFDILQMYHFSLKQLLLLYVFKILNYKNDIAKVYLKMDINDSIKSWHFGSMKKNIYRFLLIKIDLISLESKSLFDYCKKNNVLDGKIEYIPNGFYDNGIRNDVSFCEKEDVIITVGRIGTFEKNNEVLLEGFREFCKNNKTWRLEVVGPIELGFQLYIDSYFKTSPHLVNRISFTGALLDRNIINDKFRKSKIFALTSRSEGFPLVFLEAIKAGCTIISTDISTAHDVTYNSKYGGIFPIGDFMELSKILEAKVSDNNKLSDDCESIQNFAYNNFYWTNLCGRIIKLLNY